ncbi:hypothetical protein C5167_005453 [Papaver somniferum]|uniref:Plastocyanin-like domain-containing protein n=1 Tax=Papaver somniferum TaxID=3469 RepID=A0A4Y7JE17_PAPSO|nr:multicopper oxidase LPR2-like [Papaver somniferum]RZC58151.1 hypothetical protein C5167_005453 [Papaver somniferum]
MEMFWFLFLLSFAAASSIITPSGATSSDSNSTTAWRRGDNLKDPKLLRMFVDELPTMPRVRGYHLKDALPVSKILKIGMFLKQWKFHKDLPPTKVFAFGVSKRRATVPGPTIEAIHGVDTYVKWQNHLPEKHLLPWDPTIPTAKPKKGVPTVTHLHGGIIEPQSDGHSNAWFTAGFKETGPTFSKRTYRYNNHQQPGNLWYHDHAMGLTRVNILAGLFGSYIIRHPEIEDPLRLPSGHNYDQTLAIFDRMFNVDGSIYMNNTGDNPSIHPQWQPEYFGNMIIVNGKAWPKISVRRRKYRFRILNASNARFFRMLFSNGLRFIHIGSDSAYNKQPVVVDKLLLAPSEIADVVVDFSTSSSDEVILLNDAPYPFPGGDPVDQVNGKIMKFFINKKHEVDKSHVPQRLIEYPVADASGASRTRYIAMYEYTSSIDEPTHLYLNGKSYDEKVTETPKIGTSEIWYVINLTEDNHPLHIHLGLFTVLDRKELVNLDEFKECMTKNNDPIKCEVSKYAVGRGIGGVPRHEQGWKNVFKMQPGFMTEILVRFSHIHSNESYPFDASSEPGYVYHCHILDHEDNAMMRPLKLVA